MEQETLFTASKWEILKILSIGPKSPIQLAKLSNTSVANVSQQLRLLEMAGLVQSKRISNRDKGQPRLLYSLVGNHSFLIASSSDFVEKKFLRLSDYNKVILKIWFLDNAGVHHFLEKAFWHLEDKISKISAIAIDKRTLDSNQLVMIVVSDDLTIKNSLKKLLVRNPEGIAKEIQFNVKSSSELARFLSQNYGSVYALYDPNNLLVRHDSIEVKKK
jgi:predicted transcriptional regulator